jgi:hypothetical protein
MVKIFSSAARGKTTITRSGGSFLSEPSNMNLLLRRAALWLAAERSGRLLAIMLLSSFVLTCIKCMPGYLYNQLFIRKSPHYCGLRDRERVPATLWRKPLAHLLKIFECHAFE